MVGFFKKLWQLYIVSGTNITASWERYHDILLLPSPRPFVPVPWPVKGADSSVGHLQLLLVASEPLLRMLLRIAPRRHQNNFPSPASWVEIFDYSHHLSHVYLSLSWSAGGGWLGKLLRRPKRNNEGVSLRQFLFKINKIIWRLIGSFWTWTLSLHTCQEAWK